MMNKPQKRILVVDDDREMTTILQKILSASDCEIMTAEDGEEALNVMKQRSAAVVIADWKMPKCDGMQLIERIQQNHPQTKVIMITAFGDVDEYLEAMNRGAFEFLPKPLDIDELKGLVSRALTELEAPA